MTIEPHRGTRVLPREEESPPRNVPRRAFGGDPQTFYCRACHAQAAGDGAPPEGWYTVSVSAPPGTTRSGKPFYFLGILCSVRCIARSLPEWAGEEQDRRDARGES
jgi:hypothetical protein